MTDHDTAAVSAAAREQELAENAYRLVRAVESGSGLVRARPEVLAALAGIARGLAELRATFDALVSVGISTRAGS
ncbi:MAG TPA: hypothetical protein VF339_18590 [Gammaproteobacteria bacterium]